MSEQENSEVKPAGKNVHVLSRPLVFEDVTYEKLTVDFERLTGDDMISADRRFQREGGATTTFVKETSKGYLAYIVAAAAGVPVELVQQLPAKDFSSLTLSAQHFLLL